LNVGWIAEHIVTKFVNFWAEILTKRKGHGLRHAFSLDSKNA
jgi:hypothetical protein